jgi:hypothetical protein
MRVWGLCLVVFVVCVGSVAAVESRGELLFQLSAALKTGNRAYFERCFALDESDATARGQMKAIIDEILRWRDPAVMSTERKVDGGESPKMNGEWTFQVHVANGPSARQVYVFPAGPVNGGAVKILLLAK